MKNVSFICEKKYIDDNTFKIEVLKIFTQETDTIILIEGYGIIDKGEFKCILNSN